jgi:hypothetical protein
MRSLVVGVVVVLCTGLAGCKKSMDNLEKQGYESGNSGQYSGGGNPTVGGAAQAVRGAVARAATQAELHDLHIYMTNAKLSLGRVPTSQETWTAMNQVDGNRQMVKLIQDQVIILVPNPQDEGLWAYSAEVPTKGGWVLTHAGTERLTAQDYASRFGGR